MTRKKINFVTNDNSVNTDSKQESSLLDDAGSKGLNLDSGQKELLENSSIPYSVQLFAGIITSEDERFIEYPAPYPPVVTYSDEGEATGVNTDIYVIRQRARKFALENNPKLPRFMLHENSELYQGSMPVFYTPDFQNLRMNISRSGGILKLFEGDKDTWSAIAADYYNSAGIISAGQKFDTDFIETLKSLGVKTVHFYPDNDRAGWDAARKLKQALKNKFLVKAFAMPHQVNNQSIKDINDVWCAVQSNEDPVASMRDAMKNMRELILVSQSATEYSSETDYYDKELYQLIEEHLGVEKYNNKGFSNNVPCPAADHENDDTNPAFGWNKDSKIGFCFKCGEEYLAKDVARYLDIDVSKYVNSNAQHREEPGYHTEIEDESDKKKEARPDLLRIAPSLKHTLSKAEDYSMYPSEDFMYELDSGFDNLEQRLLGNISSPYDPIINPFKSFHHLGGMAHIWTRPLMAGLLGVSGGYKTSFLTSMILKLSQEGHHGIVWTPEWGVEKNADRTLQMFGGMTMNQIAMQELYYAQKSQVDAGFMSEDEMTAKPVSNDLLSSSKRKIYKMRSQLDGRIVYINQFGANALDMLMMVVEAARRMTADGTPPSYFILDYAQMAMSPWKSWTLNDLITYTKVVTMQLGLVTFVASQVRKDDVEDVMSDERKIIPSTAGMYIRDDQFNLFTTLKPTGHYTTLQGRRCEILKLAVTKNSLGSKADNIDSALTFYADVDALAVKEAVR